MELKDLLSIIALLFSAAALTLSLVNFRFTRKVKQLELRSTLLAKLVELTARLERAERVRLDISRIAGDSDPATIHLMKEGEKAIDSARKTSESIYEEIAGLPSREAVGAYERRFHVLHRASEAVASIEETLKSIHSTASKRVEKKTPSV